MLESEGSEKIVERTPAEGAHREIRRMGCRAGIIRHGSLFAMRNTGEAHDPAEKQKVTRGSQGGAPGVKFAGKVVNPVRLS